MNNSKNQELDYKDFLNQQPEDIKEMLSQFNIRSYEDLAEFSIALGIDIEKMIWDAISVTDNGDVLDKSSATLDLSALTSAMEQKEYGTILCEATATDKYGNKSSVYTIKVVYEKEDMEAPVITVLMEPTVNVDLAQVTDEAERQMLVLNTAINSIQKFNHYMVTDDVSTAEEITCTITGNYNGATVAGEHEVVLTITATDKTGKISSKEFVVMIIV